MPEYLLQRIDDRGRDLRRSENKVAEAVRAAPDEVVLSSITELAQRAGVSEPTVLRFCRTMGFSGYQDFKVGLARDLGSQESRRHAFDHFELNAEDDIETIVRKVTGTTIGTLSRLEQRLDQRALSRAIDHLSLARRIDFYGCGASAIVATDGQHKFFRMCIPTSAHVDPHMQVMSAATLGTGDVAVAVSTTGRTLSVLEAARVAAKFDATVIAITAPVSPLFELANIAIAIDAEEDVGLVTPMTSRLAHLMVIDMLAVAVASRRPNAGSRLAALKQTLRPLKAGHENGGAYAA